MDWVKVLGLAGLLLIGVGVLLAGGGGAVDGIATSTYPPEEGF